MKTYTEEKIIKILKSNDKRRLIQELDRLKGSYAVRYFLSALLEKGHGVTVPGALSLLKGI